MIILLYTRLGKIERSCLSRSTVLHCLTKLLPIFIIRSGLTRFDNPKEGYSTMFSHTFAICAYGESPYLEACIQSIMGQRDDSAVILCTATPNSLISSLAEKYHLPLCVNPAAPSIAGDWNFALNAATTEYVTLCHQDDLYEPNYRKELVKAAVKDAFQLFFSDYYELRGEKKCSSGANLLIKKILQFPLRFSYFQTQRWAKRFALRFGNGICCPSVTYHLPTLPKPLFTSPMKSNLDWDCWERLLRQEGKFCYVALPLMSHRIHTESETSRVIGNHGRRAEDL